MFDIIATTHRAALADSENMEAQRQALAASTRVAAPIKIPVGAIVEIRALEGRPLTAGTWFVEREINSLRPSFAPGRMAPHRVITLRRIGKRGKLLKDHRSWGRSGIHVESDLLATHLIRIEIPERPPEESRGNVEQAPPEAPMVRRFSVAGPCLPIGRLVRETPQFFVIDTPDYSRVQSRRVAKSTGVHTVPCPRCTDHPRSDYPHGYVD